MPKSSNLTPSQAAAVLSISASTLRRWSADYSSHLSATAKGEGGKHRTYAPDDIATLQRAGELLKTHAPAEVNQLLAIADDTDQGALVLASLPAIAGELQALRDAVMQLRGDLDAIAGDVAALQAARQADQAEIERLRSEVAGLFDRQRKRQAAQEAELEAMRAELETLKTPRRSWWQRIRKS